jgi:hypothetical protein
MEPVAVSHLINRKVTRNALAFGEAPERCTPDYRDRSGKGTTGVTDPQLITDHWKTTDQH